MIVYVILFAIKIGLYLQQTQVQAKAKLVYASMLTGFLALIWSIPGPASGGHLALYIFASTVLFIDAVYMGYFGNRPSILMIRSAGLLASVMDSVQRMLTPNRLVFIADFPILFVARQGLAQLDTGMGISNLPPWPFWLLYGTVLVIALVTGKIPALLNQDAFLFHLADLVRAVKVLRGIPPKSITSAHIEKQRALSQNPKDNAMTARAQGKNLIVLQVEGLQAFMINRSYNGIMLTPRINALIKAPGAVYNDDFMQLLGVGNTSDTEFAMVNSFYPSVEMASVFQYPDVDYYALPQLLKDQGYQAWAFHAYEPTFYHRHLNFPKWGFDRFVNAEDFEITRKVQMGMDDADFFDQVLPMIKKLAASDQPYYAHIISLTSHTPFRMPEDHQFLDLKPPIQGTMVGDYLQAIHYADRCIGAFVERLKAEGLLDDSLLVLYGDHYGISSVEGTNAIDMQRLLGKPFTHDIMMNLPLLFLFPEESQAQRVSLLGSPLDLYPTLINLLGFKNQKGIMMGRDLFSEDSDPDRLVAQQTYMPKGSFISRDKIFNAGPTGLFEDASTIRRSDKQAIPTRGCRRLMKKAIRHIDLSDAILKTNSVVKDQDSSLAEPV